ncbi:AraC family transcriptional regulator [Cohnella zeiphila]|uniref:AraC family transcriptional regulator n=1 Tax=Cohnella zeiphila TaxID=2761120 RepID=A0A7X0SIZ2_9BACL|nr:AraC family transcriptional regulator [Cohnella zeiphila]MBB6730827.1 AraC family transcriptional regulator [Cohnella zeiphila]
MLSLVKFKLDSLFARTLLSFTILVMIIIVTTTLIFSNLYSKTLYGQLSREQVKGLETLSENVDNLFKEIDQIYLNLEINTDIDFFLSSRTNDDLTNNKARIQIRNIRQINPYIHSIFVYNSVIGQSIVEGEPGFDAAGFLKHDESFRRSVNDTRAIYLTRLVKTDASPSFLTDKTANYVISMEYTNRNVSGEQQTVIINLDDDLLVRDFLSKSGDQLLFADENGTLIAHSDVTRIGSSVKNTPSFGAVLRSAADSGDVIDDEASHQSLVTFVKNRTTGWYILSSTPYRSLVAPIQDKRNGLLAVCFSILIFCLIATFLISKKLYHPVQRLTELFKRSEFHAGGSPVSDIALISQVYSETLDHMRSLEDRNRDSLQLMRENWLRRSLAAAETDEPIAASVTEEYKLRIDFERLRLCVFKIDGYARLDSPNMTLYESVLFKSVTELLGQEFRYEALRMPKGEVALFINESEGPEDGFDHLRSKLAGVKDSIAATLGITVSIGISDPIDGWGECPEAYEQANQMLQQRFVLGYNQLIYRQYVEEHLSRSLDLPADIEEKLVAAIKRNHPEGFAEALNRMTDVLGGYVYADAIRAFFQLLLACITQMNQVISDENRRMGMQFGKLNLIFTEMETLGQARDWLRQRFEDYRSSLESLSRLKDNKLYRKIEEAMHYIQENFADSSLSVESLAETAGYTPNYFSKLFKEMTGINSGEYIRKVRMAKAKELLAREEYKVSDVAEMCGYVNSSHFYSAFKRDVGMTPAAYRESTFPEKGTS